MADEYDPAFPTEETEVQEDHQECVVSPAQTAAILPPTMAEKRHTKEDTAPSSDGVYEVRKRYRTRSQATLESVAQSKTDMKGQSLDLGSITGSDSKPVLEKEMEEFEKLMHFDTTSGKKAEIKCLKEDLSLYEDNLPDDVPTMNEPILSSKPLILGSISKDDSIESPTLSKELNPAETKIMQSSLESEPPKRRSERTRRKQLKELSGSLTEVKPNIDIPPIGSDKTQPPLTKNLAFKALDNMMLPRSLKVNSTTVDKPAKDTKQLGVVAARRFGVDKESSLAMNSSKHNKDLGSKTNGIVEDVPPSSNIQPSVEDAQLPSGSASSKKKPVIEWMVGFVRKDAVHEAHAGCELWDFDVDMTHLDRILPNMFPADLLSQYIQVTDNGRRSSDVSAASSTNPMPQTLPQDTSLPMESALTAGLHVGDETLVKSENYRSEASLESESRDNAGLLEIKPGPSQDVEGVPRESNQEMGTEQASRSHAHCESNKAGSTLLSNSKEHSISTCTSTESASPKAQPSDDKSFGQALPQEALVNNVCSSLSTKNLPVEMVKTKPDVSTLKSVSEDSLSDVGERKVGDVLLEESVLDLKPAVSMEISSTCQFGISDPAKERMFKPIQSEVGDADSHPDASKDGESPKSEGPKQRKRSWRGNKARSGLDESSVEAMPTRRSTRLRSIEKRRKSESPKDFVETPPPPGRKRRLSSRNSNESPLDDISEPGIKKSSHLEPVKTVPEGPPSRENIMATATELQFKEKMGRPDEAGRPDETIVDEVNITVPCDETLQRVGTRYVDVAISPLVQMPAIITSEVVCVASPAVSSDVNGQTCISHDVTITDSNSHRLLDEGTDNRDISLEVTLEASMSNQSNPVHEMSKTISTSDLLTSDTITAYQTSPVAEVSTAISASEIVTSKADVPKSVCPVDGVSPNIPASEVSTPEATTSVFISPVSVPTTSVMTSLSTSTPFTSTPADKEAAKPNQDKDENAVYILQASPVSQSMEGVEINQDMNSEAMEVKQETASEMHGVTDMDEQSNPLPVVPCDALLKVADAKQAEEQDGKQLQVDENHVQVEGNQLQVEGNRLQVEGNQLQVEGNQLQVEGNQLQVEGNQLQVEGNQLQVEGNQLQVEVNQLQLEGTEEHPAESNKVNLEINVDQNEMRGLVPHGTADISHDIQTNTIAPRNQRQESPPVEEIPAKHFFNHSDEFTQDVWEENFTDYEMHVEKQVHSHVPFRMEKVITRQFPAKLELHETQVSKSEEPLSDKSSTSQDAPVSSTNSQQPLNEASPTRQDDPVSNSEPQQLLSDASTSQDTLISKSEPHQAVDNTPLAQDVNLKGVEEGEVVDHQAEDSREPENSSQSWGIVTGDQVPHYESIPENYYLSERKKSKAGKEARRMVCDCTTSKSDRSRGFPACGEDCLNRLLLIECTSRCPCGDYCTNRRFSQRKYGDVGVSYADNKGHGLKCKTDMKPHDFVMEYCGEVLNYSEFKSRVKRYNKDDQLHFYFMALRADEIIDATLKGNMSRFINHSCDPNCETQKWTVNGQIRVGFFTKKSIAAGTELTFDYQFEQYGENAQKCLCGSANCRGFIGKQKRQPKTATPKRKESVDRRRKESFEDASLDDEIEQLCSELDGRGLRTNDQTLTLARHMVLAETTPLRLQLLKILEDTADEMCLKHFLTHHGLKLLWSWMVDIGDKPELELKTEILNTLVKLPIPHKNALEDSKIFSMVERWSKVKHIPKAETEVEDSSASETPSRCATPVSITLASRNTPTELAVKLTDNLTSESDGDNDKAALKQPVDVAKPESASASPVDKTGAVEQEIDQKTEVDSSTPNVEDVAPSQSDLTSAICTDSSNVTQSEIVSQSYESVEMKAVDENAESEESKIPETPALVTQPDSVITSAAANQESDAVTDSLISQPESNITLQIVADSETVSETKNTSLDQPVKPNNLEEGELPSDQAEVKSEDKEKIQVSSKQDVGSDSDATDAGTKVDKTSGVALLAGRLLETWSSLKEIYRIPKNRDRERDRDYSERDRDRDRDRGHDRDRRYGRDRDRDRDYDRDRDRDRDRHRDRDSRRERSRERDRYRDRERDRKRNWDRREDRKRRSRSASKEKEDKQLATSTEKKDGDISKSTLPKLRKPWKNDTGSTIEGAQGKAVQGKAVQSKPAKTEKPGLSKEERRQQFAKQVEQADMEEELRKQQEEEFLRQHPHFVDEEGNIHFVDANGFPIPPPFEGDPNHPMMHMMHPDQGVPMEHGGMPMEHGGMPMEHGGMPMEHGGMPMEGGFPHHMNPGYHEMMPHPQGMVPLDENGMPIHGQPMYEDMQPDMGMPQDQLMHHPHGMDGPPMPPHLMPHEGMHPMHEQDPQGWEPHAPQNHPPHPQPVLPQPQFRVPAPPGPNNSHIPVVAGTSRPASYVVPQQPQQQVQPVQPAPQLPTQTHVIQQQVVQPQPQPAAPAQTVTFVTPDGMLVTQTIMPLNTESNVQTNIQQAQQIQQHLNQGMSTSQGIPSPPSKPKAQQLPPNWRTARDQEGKIYYYHAITRQTQWDMPSWDGNAPVLGGAETDMDLGTPTYDEKSKKRTTTAAADTSSELAKRCKLQFRSKMSHYVISCLNTYRKPDCKVGRITNTEDFKHLARKLTHGIMDKELKHCKNFEDLEVNSNVKHKAKEYIKKYMTHVGPVYHKDD